MDNDIHIRSWTFYEISQDIDAEDVIDAIANRSGREKQRQWWQDEMLPLIVDFKCPFVLTMNKDFCFNKHLEFSEDILKSLDISGLASLKLTHKLTYP